MEESKTSFYKGITILKPNHSCIVSDKSKMGMVKARENQNFLLNSSM